MEKLSSSQKYQFNELSEEETQQILTPFAFKIDKSLFGIALASPSRRAIALIIDLGLITLLSDISGIFLALVISITLYGLGNKNRAIKKGKIKGNKRRAFMRGIGALILFVILLDVIPSFYQKFSDKQLSPSSDRSGIQIDSSDVSIAQTLIVGKYTIEVMALINNSDCMQYDCWQQQLTPFLLSSSEAFNSANINVYSDDFREVVSNVVEETQLNEHDSQKLTQYILNTYQTMVVDNGADNNKQLKQHKPNKQQSEIVDTALVDEEAIVVEINKQTEQEEKRQVKEEEEDKPIYSVIQWFKGIINDLGLGFGWAAFYFTALTALWGGQTIGKKLLGIKVLQLDGTPLSIWDSFGRYGGYGAGIATGLLGFLQIYWDANRQAIQDKISSTVVIDVKKSAIRCVVAEKDTASCDDIDETNN